MKKTLVALAVLAAAGSVNAAEVYNADGIVTNVSGVAEVQVINNQSFADADVAVRIDDFDLTANTVVAINDDWSALGEVSLSNGSTTVDRTFVGFTSATAGTITFGQQLLIADDAGNSADFEFGGSQYGETITSGTDVVKYVFDNGQFFAGISHDLQESNTENTVTDGRVGFRSGAFDAVAYVYDREDKANDIEVSSFDLEANYAQDEISVSASYGQSKSTVISTDAETKTRYMQANVGYTVDTVTYNVGVSQAKPEGSKAVNTVYANVIKQLATNVRVYAEAGNTSTDDSEFGSVVGMEVKF